MNKEQAKATIESESLLRQEAMNNIRGNWRRLPLRVMRKETLYT